MSDLQPTVLLKNDAVMSVCLEILRNLSVKLHIQHIFHYSCSEIIDCITRKVRDNERIDFLEIIS